MLQSSPPCTRFYNRGIGIGMHLGFSTCVRWPWHPASLAPQLEKISDPWASLSKSEHKEGTASREERACSWNDAATAIARTQNLLIDHLRSIRQATLVLSMFTCTGSVTPFREGGMSNVLDAANAAELRSPDHCRHCGSMVRPMPILDSLQGKSFQMLRCVNCEKVSWREKR